MGEGGVEDVGAVLGTVHERTLDLTHAAAGADVLTELGPSGGRTGDVGVVGQVAGLSHVLGPALRP
jgi:hypothetical protein